jgi:ELWxxDGT repeat protein
MLPHRRHNVFSAHVLIRRSPRSLLLLALLPLIVGAAISHADTHAYLVKDFVGGVVGSTAVARNHLFFGASHETQGAGLWKSDGTPAGTSLVFGMVPGSGSSRSGFITATTDGFITAVNDSVFFTSNGIWRTDGTASGTVRLVDPLWASYPFDLTKVNSTLFFASTADIMGSSTTGLWKSDGTPAGTVLLHWHPHAIGSLTRVQGHLFYTAIETEHSWGLWVSDGTAAGTMQLMVFTNESTSYRPNEPLIRTLTAVGGRLFFSAYTSGQGYELWQSDGTIAGTVRVSAALPASVPWAIADIQGTAFMLLNDLDQRAALWRSDGTAAGTTVVKTFAPEQRPYDPGFLVNLNGIAVFPLKTIGALPDELIIELWRSDGTSEGTVAVKAVSIRDGIRPSVSCGKLFFTAYGFDGLSGDDLWVSDGSAAGTLRVYDGGNGYSLYGHPLQPLTKVGDVLLFTDYSLWAIPIGLDTASVSNVDSLPYHLYIPLALGHPRC